MRLPRNPALGLAVLVLLPVVAKALEWKTTALTVATAPFQATVEALFEFKNDGPRPVTIRAVDTNCDCLEATADRKIYAPGSSGWIKARFTLGDRTGVYVRSITVTTDEPDSPVRLSLQTDVPPVAVLTPRSVTWQRHEAVVDKSIDLVPAAGLEVIFTTAQATNESFIVQLDPVEPGHHYRLKLRPRDTHQPASAAIRIFGREKSGHEVIVSAYASVE